MDISELKNYFENQSALANFLQISFATATIVISLWKAYFYARQRLSSPRVLSLIQYLEQNRNNNKDSTSLKTLILDDELLSYPTTELRIAGYSITEKTSVSLSEIETLKDYDVILLDIRGVLKEDPKSGGVEILKRLKKDKARPYVIAVSSRGFDPTLAEFFMLANERLKKPIPSAMIEAAIKTAYEIEFSAKHAAKRIDKVIGTANPSNGTAKRNLKLILAHLKGRLESDKLQLQLEKSLSREVVSKIISDINIINIESM